MDTTPIFRPPTPPQGGLFFSLLCILLISLPTTADSTASSFILYYQPLQTFDLYKTNKYIKELRVLFSSNLAKNHNRLLIDYRSEKVCPKGSQGVCKKTLYGRDPCIPKNERPGLYCLKKSAQITTASFKEPVFNRIAWNRFSVSMNRYCNDNQNPLCKRLAMLHTQYMRDYKKIVKSRKTATARSVKKK